VLNGHEVPMKRHWGFAFAGVMAVYTVGTFGAITSHLPWGLRAIGLLWPSVAVLLGLAGGVISVGTGAACAARRRWRDVASSVLLAVSCVCGTWWSISALTMSCERSWSRITKNGAPVVVAVQAYITKYGHVPRSLDALVPEFISRVPETEVACHPWFRLGPSLGPASSSGWSIEVRVGHAGGPQPLLVYWPEGRYPKTVGESKFPEGWLTSIPNGWAHFQPND
jgi:hypothetical protein